MIVTKVEMNIVRHVASSNNRHILVQNDRRCFAALPPGGAAAVRGSLDGALDVEEGKRPR